MTNARGVHIKKESSLLAGGIKDFIGGLTPLRQKKKKFLLLIFFFLVFCSEFLHTFLQRCPRGVFQMFLQFFIDALIKLLVFARLTRPRQTRPPFAHAPAIYAFRRLPRSLFIIFGTT